MQDTLSSDRITRAIFEHAAGISREHDIAGIIRLNADFARDLAGADRCSLWLLDHRTQPAQGRGCRRHDQGASSAEHGIL